MLPVANLKLKQAAALYGTVIAAGLKNFRRRRGSVFELILEVGDGRVHCRWWNQAFRKNQFKKGDQLFIYGKTVSMNPVTIDHPDAEVVESDDDEAIHVGRVTPIYPLTEGITQRWLRSLTWKTLEAFSVSLPEGSKIEDNGLSLDLRGALKELHFPTSLDSTEPARRRLAIQEFIELHDDFLSRRQALEARAPSRPCRPSASLVNNFKQEVGFDFTEAQNKAFAEIDQDLRPGRPMRRLLQGDVGSGKTVVATSTALVAVENGYSVAFMAPTEILAEQHFQNLRKWFEPLEVPLFLRTRNHRDERLDQGHEADLFEEASKPCVVVGTHALIEDKVNVPNLGMVIIDEQHKFGVEQREKLVKKGNYPHLLVMSATPIPRTLGLTLYGDLDLTIMDKAPPGRGTVKTYVRETSALPKVWSFIKDKLAQGRQAYVVYPQVEQSAQQEVKSVKKEWQAVSERLAPYGVGLIHGRLSSEEKDSVMQQFRSNDIQVLVATTVIEVGVDVPNANLMLIENADRFGLIQLHQLRGRIGRGEHDSYCILVGDSKTEEGQERLKVMEQTTNGFEIAEADLQMRGPGDLLGKQQSGLPPLRFGDLQRDYELLVKAKGLRESSLKEQMV